MSSARVQDLEEKLEQAKAKLATREKEMSAHLRNAKAESARALERTEALEMQVPQGESRGAALFA